MRECEHNWCPLCQIMEWVGDRLYRWRMRRRPFKPVTIEEIQARMLITEDVMRRNLEGSLFSPKDPLR